QTVVRPARVPVEPPEPGVETVAAEERAAAPASGGRLPVVGIVIGAVVVVAAIVVALVLFVPGIVSGSKPVATPTSGGGPIVVSAVPDPQKGVVTPSPDGTSVTFTWTNPKPKAGDTFAWSQVGGNPTPTETAQAVVTGVVPGSRVCIQVVVVRDGQTSPNPLTECTA
ncbi:MAG: serine/threonine protein kinase, partial [Microbacteriaceae bacterium]|nr:serine/threonine protein kinase [Microbacteriaceae bacterium]